MRYHFHGHFVEEQKKGFAVHHEIQKDCDTFAQLRDIHDGFLESYSAKYCYGLSLGISEEPTLADT